jgi:hypothetical protein
MLAAVLIATTILPHGGQSVSALEYSGSAGYMSGKYYRALTEVQLTGDPRTDIVNIALSQVGYQEGGSSNQLSGEVYGGVNYTEYGRWYGVQNMWCAMFASWCANVAGISTSVIPKHAYTPDGLKWFRDRGLAFSRAKVAAGEYTPQPGDIIYFKSSRNKNPTNHVGIVSGYSNGTVYVIEGNTSSASISTNGGTVAQKSYAITNTYIVYICCPDYEQTGMRLVEDKPAKTETPKKTEMTKVTDEYKALRKAIYTMECGEENGYDRVCASFGGIITVGSGQWYGVSARDLLLRIRKADPTSFAKLDTTGIGDDLDQQDWSDYRIDVSSEKADCIRQILGSKVGVRVQDELMNEQLRACRKEAVAMGVKDQNAQLLCAGLCYVGGTRMLQQVLQSVQGAYTVENIRTAMNQMKNASVLRSGNVLCDALKN